MKSQASTDYVVYIHVYSDGEIFIYPCQSPFGYLTDIQELTKELERARANNGRVLFSIEESEHESEPLLETVTGMILKHEIQVQMVDPHPEVYGYDKSYAPYLEEALEVARVDVEGLERYLKYTEESLEESEPGTPAFKQREKVLDIIKSRLVKAREAQERLTSVHFELCVGGELLQ